MKEWNVYSSSIRDGEFPAEGNGGKEKDKKAGRQKSERQREASSTLKLSVTVSFRHTEHLALSLKRRREEKRSVQESWERACVTDATIDCCNKHVTPSMLFPCHYSPDKTAFTFLRCSLQSLSHAVLAPFFFFFPFPLLLFLQFLIQSMHFYTLFPAKPRHYIFCFSFYALIFSSSFQTRKHRLLNVGWTWIG